MVVILCHKLFSPASGRRTEGLFQPVRLPVADDQLAAGLLRFVAVDTIRAPHEVAALADAGWFCSAGAVGAESTGRVAVFVSYARPFRTGFCFAAESGLVPCRCVVFAPGIFQQQIADVLLVFDIILKNHHMTDIPLPTACFFLIRPV